MCYSNSNIQSPASCHQMSQKGVYGVVLTSSMLLEAMEKKTVAELTKEFKDKGKSFNEADFFHKRYSKYQKRLEKYGLDMDIVPDSQIMEEVVEEVIPNNETKEGETREDTSDGTFVFLGVEVFDWHDGGVPLFFSEILDDMKMAEEEYTEIRKTLKKRRIVKLLKTKPRHLIISFER